MGCQKNCGSEVLSEPTVRMCYAQAKALSCYKILNHRENRGADHANGETNGTHNDSHYGVGLEHFLFGQTAHLGNDPEAGIVHPADRFRSAANCESDIDWVIA